MKPSHFMYQYKIILNKINDQSINKSNLLNFIYYKERISLHDFPYYYSF